MHFRKLVLTIVSMLTVITLLNIQSFTYAYANENIGTLDDFIKGIRESNTIEEYENETEQQNEHVNEHDKDIDNKIEKDEQVEMKSFLEDVTDISMVENTEEMSKITDTIHNAFAFVIQIAVYVVMILLVLRVILDLTYICIPFVRTFLNSGSNNTTPTQPMNNMNSMGSFSNMGGMSMNSMTTVTRPNMNNNNSSIHNIQIVSNAAINAVNSTSPLRIYCKDMIIVLVATPILLLLAITGSLTDLGFAIGDALIKAINTFIK